MHFANRTASQIVHNIISIHNFRDYQYIQVITNANHTGQTYGICQCTVPWQCGKWLSMIKKVYEGPGLVWLNQQMILLQDAHDDIDDFHWCTLACEYNSNNCVSLLGHQINRSWVIHWTRSLYTKTWNCVTVGESDYNNIITTRINH